MTGKQLMRQLMQAPGAPDLFKIIQSVCPSDLNELHIAASLNRLAKLLPLRQLRSVSSHAGFSVLMYRVEDPLLMWSTDGRTLATIFGALARLSHHTDSQLLWTMPILVRKVQATSGSGSAQSIATIAWASSKLQVVTPELFTAIATSMNSPGFVESMLSQDVSNLLWAFAAARQHDLVLQKLLDRLQSRSYLSTFETQGLCNTLWAMAVLDLDANGILRYICDELQRPIHIESLRRDNYESVPFAFRALCCHGKDGLAESWRLLAAARSQGLDPGMQSLGVLLAACEKERNTVLEIQLLLSMANASGAEKLVAAFYFVAGQRLMDRGAQRRATPLLQIAEAAALGKRIRPHPLRWGRRCLPTILPSTTSIGTQYQKELLILRFVLKSLRRSGKHGMNASANRAQVVLDAIEKFAKRKQWLKIGGGDKAAILNSLAALARPKIALEIGTYCCGYSAMQLATRLKQWEGKVFTIEVDPVNACIARWLIACAGLSESIEVLLGRGEDRIPDLCTQLGAQSVGLLFLDHRGTVYHKDLELCRQVNLLLPGAIVLADNVLSPGAPEYIWHVMRSSAAGGYAQRACVLEVSEYGRTDQRDWMVACVVTAAEQDGMGSLTFLTDSPLPASLQRCARAVDNFAWHRAALSSTAWVRHANRVERDLHEAGLKPKLYLGSDSASWLQELFSIDIS